MALSTFPFLTANGDLRNRSVNGAGTIADPDVAIVEDTVNTIAINNLSAKVPTLGPKAVSGSVSVTPATGSKFTIDQIAYLRTTRLAISAGDNIKSTSGVVFSFVATNLGSSTRFLQLFNKNSAPVTGDVPTAIYPVFGSNMLIIDTAIWGLAGLSLTSGISWGISTTPTTYTAGPFSEVLFEINYL